MTKQNCKQCGAPIFAAALPESLRVMDEDYLPELSPEEVDAIDGSIDPKLLYKAYRNGYLDAKAKYARNAANWQELCTVHDCDNSPVKERAQKMFLAFVRLRYHQVEEQDTRYPPKMAPRPAAAAGGPGQRCKKPQQK